MAYTNILVHNLQVKEMIDEKIKEANKKLADFFAGEFLKIYST